MLGAAEEAGAGVEVLLLAVPNKLGVVVDEVVELVVVAGLFTMKLNAGLAAVESVQEKKRDF